MATNDDPARPLWPTFTDIPYDIWNIYYQGMTGRWLLGSNCYSQETAERMAAMYDRPTKILHFTLTDIIDVDNAQLRSKHGFQPRKVTKIRQPKKITKVRMPKKG